MNTTNQSSCDLASIKNLPGKGSKSHVRNSRNFTQTSGGTHHPIKNINKFLIGSQSLKKSIEINLNPKKGAAQSRSRMAPNNLTIDKYPT